MLRITRETDYGVVLLARLTASDEAVMNARDLATETQIPQPTVSKILKALARGGLLESHRGVKGGYSLAHDPESISIASVIRVLEGPIALTDCADSAHADGADHSDCEHLSGCPVQGNWNRINQAIQATLEGINLVEMTGAEPSRKPKAMEV